VGDAKSTISALLPKLTDNAFDEHLKASLEHYRKARKGLDELAIGDSGKKPIHPQYVCPGDRRISRQRRRLFLRCGNPDDLEPRAI